MRKIKVHNIIISEDFKRTTPRAYKMELVREYVSKYGEIDTPVVLNNENLLVDGYTRYLVALEYGFKKIPYVKDLKYRNNATFIKRIINKLSMFFNK